MSALKIGLCVEDIEVPAALRTGLRADARALLKAIDMQEAELSLVLCSDPHIATLNAQWRNKEGPTDVLSFPQDDEVVLGDLVLSVPTATRQAEERGYGLRDELRVLMVHGLLHLLGYDHELGEAEHQEMAEAEARLMARLGWTGQGLIAAAGLPSAPG